LIQAELRWVAAHLCRLHGDIDRAVASLEIADRLIKPRFNFLGGLAHITRSALCRWRGEPNAAAAIIAGLVQQHYPHEGITDIPMRLVEELAFVACAQGRLQDSADLLATASAARQRQGLPLSPVCGLEIDQLRAQLGGRPGTVLAPESAHSLAASLAIATS
jgi:hypothetical protein